MIAIATPAEPALPAHRPAKGHAAPQDGGFAGLLSLVAAPLGEGETLPPAELAETAAKTPHRMKPIGRQAAGNNLPARLPLMTAAPRDLPGDPAIDVLDSDEHDTDEAGQAGDSDPATNPRSSATDPGMAALPALSMPFLSMPVLSMPTPSMSALPLAPTAARPEAEPAPASGAASGGPPAEVSPGALFTVAAPPPALMIGAVTALSDTPSDMPVTEPDAPVAAPPPADAAEPTPARHSVATPVPANPVVPALVLRTRMADRTAPAPAAAPSAVEAAPVEVARPALRPAAARVAPAMADAAPPSGDGLPALAQNQFERPARVVAAFDAAPAPAIPAAQPATVLPAEAAPVRTTPEASPARTDLAQLVDRLVEAREAASPRTVEATIAHAEFGRVALAFRHEQGTLAVSMASADPGFAAAAQVAAITAPGAMQAGGDALPQRHDGGGHASFAASSQGEAQPGHGQPAPRNQHAEAPEQRRGRGDEPQSTAPRARRAGLYV